MNDEMKNKKKQVCMLLDIKNLAYSLLGTPEYINKNSKWNIVYKSFYKHEKTPSFKISEKLQVFKCFATGSYGDVVKLYKDFMKYEKNIDLDTDSACDDLISRFSLNIDLQKEVKMDKKLSEKNKRISLILMGIVQYSNHELLSNTTSKAYDYLEKRGIERESIVDFGLGFVNDNAKLTKFLATKFSITMNELILYGFYNDDEKFQLLNRLIIPIHERNGQVVSLSSRDLHNNNPKYKQISIIPDSSNAKLFFTANSYLYGLNLAKTYIDAENEVILVEGYFDVIRFFQLGIYNVIGIQTAYLTEEQKKALASFQRKDIVVFFDGDITGQIKQKTLLSELSVLKKDSNLVYKSLWFIEEKEYIEQNSDPDTFFKNKSKNFAIDILKNRIDYRNFIIENAIYTYKKSSSYLIENLYHDVGDMIFLYNNSYLKSIEEMVITTNKGKDKMIFEQLFYNDTEAEALWLMNELNAEFDYCCLILKNAKHFIETLRTYEGFLDSIRKILLSEFEEYTLINNTPKKIGRLYGNNKNKLRIDVEDEFENIIYTFELDYIKGVLFFLKRFSDEIIDHEKRNEKNFFDVKVFSKLWSHSERENALKWIEDYFKGAYRL